MKAGGSCRTHATAALGAHTLGAAILAAAVAAAAGCGGSHNAGDASTGSSAQRPAAVSTAEAQPSTRSKRAPRSKGAAPAVPSPAVAPGAQPGLPIPARGARALTPQTAGVRAFEARVGAQCRAAASSLSTKGLRGSGAKSSAPSESATASAARLYLLTRRTVALLSRTNPPATVRAPVKLLTRLLRRLQSLYLVSSHLGARARLSVALSTAERQARATAAVVGLPDCAPLAAPSPAARPGATPPGVAAPGTAPQLRASGKLTVPSR